MNWKRPRLVVSALAMLLAPQGIASTLTVRTEMGPGLNYFRAAAPILKRELGVDVQLDEVPGDWIDAKPVTERAPDLAALRGGKIVGVIYRHLTAKEKAQGLNEAVLGFFGGILMVNPQAPIESIDSKKWQAYLQQKNDAKPLRWSTIANVAPDKDALVNWALPGPAALEWARPLTLVSALPQRFLANLPKAGGDDALAALAAVHTDVNRIGVFGYNYVKERMESPLNPLKTLQVDGIVPRDETFADETYKLQRPIVMVFASQSVKSAAATTPTNPTDSGDSAVKKILAWIGSRSSHEVATMRALVPAKALIRL